jgi:anti-sigma regulatory factor (Ser/Thr protein kinase)
VEVITGSHHVVFPMEDTSRIGEARRHAAQLAHENGFDDVEAGRLALIVTELGTNLLRHAQNGRLLLSARPLRAEVEVVSIDEGPGIADVERSLGDGFSTAGTPGTGLGAVRRLAGEFDLHSSVPGGTVVVARIRSRLPAPPGPATESVIAVGAISLAAPGERVCGDAWGFAVHGNKGALLVADGLGHGPQAAEAAQAALAVFQAEPMLAPRQLLERCHARLRSTRGAALALLQADATAEVIRIAGAGNVVSRLVSGLTDRMLLTQHGTAGVAMRAADETTVPWPPHALLVVCSDGIGTRWLPEALLPVLGRDPALAAALLVRDHCRGRDDATVAVLRRKD